MKKNRFIVLFVSIAVLAVLYNLFFASDQLRRVDKLQTFVARHQAQALDAFIMAFRRTYQEAFLQNHIPLNEQNIKLLPVMTTKHISEKFSDLIAHKATIRVVSDNPRNPRNIANELEMRSIEYFRNHPDAKEQYEIIGEGDEERFYYASPLYIKKQCLKCHGSREEAPPYIRTHYDKAYGYKEGDLRGIIGIYLSQSALRQSVEEIVYRNVFKMMAITVLFLGAFFFLLKKIYRKDREYTETLESEVAKKTDALQKQSRELEYRLYHDLLTDLPNRNSLILDIDRAPAEALILVNIDDFNEINDFYGHATGDLLIKKLAELLKNKCPLSYCRLYRMPSDEFALLLTKKLGEKELEAFLKELIATINGHDFLIDEETVVHLRIAAGASNGGADLLITADMAMKKAKAERKDFVVYDDSIDLSERYRKNLEWAEKLKRAIEEDRIVPYFQPIVATRTGEVKIYEALIRIVDEDGTVHTPFHFLDIAKRTKYYPELTKRMADKVFTLLKQIPHDISLNISYLDIINKETMKYIIDKMENCPHHERIHFEILESEGIERYDEVFECLRRLKSHGCHISLDDFGSGYSNFEHILKLEVDMLKIDGSLIKSIDTDIGSQIIVETIVDFARKLNIDTCAEFVCSESVYETVKDLGVTYVQGYYIDEPKPIEAILRK
ncbi:EAL domain-containing protein [Hydrogenimonas sp.]